jgi:ribosomal protein L7/L12
MKIKLLFNYKNLNQKLHQIKLLQTLFALSLKEAKYAVDCGELILQECDENLVEIIRSNSDANIEVVILSSQETEKHFN